MTQIGVEYRGQPYNFSQAWEIYKEIKNKGRGPSLNFLQLMVEADFFHLDTFLEVLQTLQEYRPIDDLRVDQYFRYDPPVGRPQKILCIGRNYKAHADELGHTVPEEPMFFSKSPSAIIGHEDAIRLPRSIGRVDYEGEMGVVISKSAFRIERANVFDYIAGYTILIDVTARDLQKSDIKAGKPWFRSKSFDTFCPMGPFLLPKEAVPDLDSVQLELKINGVRKQFASNAEMIFDIPETVCYLSRFLTLQPGDLISMGTPEGVGPLKQGDVVECEITDLGTLRNTVKSD